MAQRWDWIARGLEGGCLSRHLPQRGWLRELKFTALTISNAGEWRMGVQTF